MSAIIYYVGTQQEITDALDRINSNCSFPNEDCQTWDIPTQAYLQNFWFFKKPPVSGYRQKDRFFSQQTMIEGVTNVTEQPFQDSWMPQPSWLPPSPIVRGDS